MQSEFAAHIGLRGKYFCRACWVKGSDATADADPSPRERGDVGNGGGVLDPGSDRGSAVGSDDTGSDAASSEAGHVQPGAKSKGRRRKAVESMAGMMSRIKTFIKVYSHLSSGPVVLFIVLFTL